AALARVVEAGADDLVRAVGRGELVAGLAHARERVELAGLAELREREALRPDAAVDVADHDAAAGAVAARTTQLLPQPARRGEAEEVGRRDGVGGVLRVDAHAEHAARVRELGGLVGGHARSEAVERGRVVVQALQARDAGRHARVTRLQVAAVALDGRA